MAISSTQWPISDQCVAVSTTTSPVTHTALVAVKNAVSGSVQRPSAEENGSINIAEDVVAAIAADAIGEIEGVGSMCQNMTEQITEQFTGKKGLRGVRAEVKDGEIIVDVYLMVRYGYAIPETARKVQDSVSAAVSGMTGYNVHAVNVHVGGISFN